MKETRWNFTFYMMERYLEKGEVIHTALCIQDRNDLVLSTEKNPFIKEMIKILCPFEEVTTELFSKNYVSASKIIPLARILLFHTSLLAFVKNISQNLTAQMATRFRGHSHSHTPRPKIKKDIFLKCWYYRPLTNASLSWSIEMYY